MQESHDPIDLPDELPVVPLRQFVVFPYMALPLFLGRDRSVRAVDDALAADRFVLLVAQRDVDLEEPDPDDLHRFGTVAMVMRSMRLPDGRVKALVQGLARTRVESYSETEESCAIRARVQSLDADREPAWSVEIEAVMRAVRSRVEELLALKNLPPEVLAVAQNVQEPGRLADLVASNLKLRLAHAQEVLEICDPLARLRRVDALLRRELEVSAVQAEIQSQAKEELTRGHREQFLREQLRAIQAELGDGDPRFEEIEEYREKLRAAQLPEEAETEAFRQLQRLERMHPEGPEAQVLRGFLDWMVELPWAVSSPDRIDLHEARNILDADHAHLERIKDRILEHLGVRKLRPDAQGPILCLVGPPGVGKTSLGRSIARAMGREFVRVSLGGVRDEAEIRGHRRTYVGALPGRILQGLRQAGTRNPVFMLDEIDKLGNDFRGDPASALLEVLDPEQNAKFSDHYLNTPFDLSRVMWITTANLIDPIPGPLRDRMEVIRLAGYTPEEKAGIAGSFLIPRQMVEHGLPPDRIQWASSAIGRLVSGYTAEAGVRNLERQVAAICRKIARRAAEGDERRVRVSARLLPSLLGAPRYLAEELQGAGEIGVANGLAWTEHGGEMLRVEVETTPGQGLVLTGQLGDVMKESGQAALTWARAYLARAGIDDAALARRQVHVHVPAGGIPKDGPSAGITLATALVSLAIGRPVRADVAMTGEVTLRGRVLPVGGVREKALAALRAGVSRVIVPERNLPDLDEIPREARRQLEFIAASHMEEVLTAALEGEAPTPRRAPLPRRSPLPAAVPAAASGVDAKE
ncbi:endopeptidase La [Myxococcota bacterium]|nr:endopeptidase La [Myxococcota bacterium]MCZ7620130.1 endopeptidase La [Myxococcota bacterium]